MSVLRYDYADTDAGQLHLTIAGSGPAVVLMHWTPLSARMYEDELPRLAERGYQAVGVDLMGFDRSAKPGEVWPFERHAEVVIQGLLDKAFSSFAVLGAHFSAPVAVEMTLSNTVQVSALMLDGCGHLLPKEAADAITAKVGKTAGPGLHTDGSHRTFLWDQTVNAYGIFDPDFEVNDGTVGRIYRFIGDYVATGFPKDFGTFAPYDMAGKLKQVAKPGCVITAETDPLRTAQEPTVKCLADAQAVTFPGSHPLHDPARSGEYANAIADFLDSL